MSDHTGSDTFGAIPNDSEAIQNGSEQTAHVSEPFRMTVGAVPKTAEVSSEASYSANLPDARQSLFENRTVPNDTSPLRNHTISVPNEGKLVRNRADNVSDKNEDRSEPAPNRSEQFRTAPTCAPGQTTLTITVREAARIFEEAGVPRTERAITNWCNQNARGVTRLECCYNNEERKYYISPNTISKAIQEERKKVQYTEYSEGNIHPPEAEHYPEQAQNNSEPDRERNTNGVSDDTLTTNARKKTYGREERRAADSQPQHSADGEGLGAEDRATLKEMQMENFELRVQLEGQKYLVRQFDSLVDGERERHEREKLALVDRLTEARYQIGTLEQKLLQLDAGNTPVREAQTTEGGEHLHTNDMGNRADNWQRTVS